MIDLTERHKRILTWVGYPMLALVTFVFALSWTFPYDRLEGKIEQALSDKYDVQIGSIESTLLPGGIVLQSVTVKTRPKAEDEKPITIYVEQIELNIGLLAALTGTISVDITADLGGGRVAGHNVPVEFGIPGAIPPNHS